MDKPKPSIGVISGLGPLAGSEVLRKIFEYSAKHYGAQEDADYPDVVVVSHGIDGFDAQGKISQDFKPELIRVVQKLERLQPTVVGIACNTAHVYLDELKTRTKAKFINIIEETVTRATKTDKYLLLASTTTNEGKLYHAELDRQGVEFVGLSDAQQHELDEVIGLVMACKLDEAGAKIEGLIANLAEKKFTAIIAGCTELPIALGHSSLGWRFPIIDSTQVLAEALVDALHERG